MALIDTTYAGSLKKKTITDLSEICLKSALAQANMSPEIVNSIIMGNVSTAVLTLNVAFGETLV